MPRPLTAGLRSVVVAVAGAGLTAAALLGASAARAAPSLVSFSVAGSADALRVTVTQPGAPLSDQLADAATPSASAALSNLDGSLAYGSFVYPGATALSAPGLVSGVIGQSLPRYPVIASSDDQHPSADQSVGPVAETAKSAPDSSRGNAAVTLATGGTLSATGEATVDRASGTLTGTGTSVADGLSFGGVLTLSAQGTAKVVRVGSGAPVLTSSIAAGRVVVAGQQLGLTDHGLVLAGTTTPLPADSPVTAPLRDAGITVTLARPEKLKDGIRSGAVEVTVVTTTPTGPATSTYLLGSALAVATATTDAPTTTATPTGPGGTGTGTGTTTGSGSTGTGTGSAVAPATGDPGTGRPTGGTTTGTALPGPRTAARQPALRTTALQAGSAPFAQLDSLSFYLVLVLGGGVALAGQQGLRRLGVARP